MFIESEVSSTTSTFGSAVDVLGVVARKMSVSRANAGENAPSGFARVTISTQASVLRSRTVRVM